MSLMFPTHTPTSDISQALPPLQQGTLLLGSESAQTLCALWYESWLQAPISHGHNRCEMPGLTAQSSAQPFVISTASDIGRQAVSMAVPSHYGHLSSLEPESTRKAHGALRSLAFSTATLLLVVCQLRDRETEAFGLVPCPRTTRGTACCPHDLSSPMVPCFPSRVACCFSKEVICCFYNNRLPGGQGCCYDGQLRHMGLPKLLRTCYVSCLDKGGH